MNKKNSPQSVIDKFQKRQKMLPYFLGGMAALLVIIGLVVIILVAAGGGNAFGGLFPSKTPTPSATPTETPVLPTEIPTMTPTITETPTPTMTNTPSGPQLYEVQEGDFCSTIAEKFGVDLITLIKINPGILPTAQNACPIKVGDRIIIPAPGQVAPTPTIVPSTIPRGTLIDYMVEPNDTLKIIAAKFRSTIEAIKQANRITNENLIYVGQMLKIPVNLVTATPSVAPTSTLSGHLVTPPSRTSTPTP